MVIPHIVVLVAASLAVLGLPCAVAVAVRADGFALRRAWVRQGRQNRPALCRLEHELRDADLPLPGARPSPGPSLRQVEAELRRLDAQRHGGPTGGSEMWSAAVDRAYDQWLQIACRYLSVTAHLPVTGDDLDRDLERLRVEAKLADAGLRIRPPRRPPR